MSTDAVKPRLTRRGHPKTRLGCRTCKKRHVKCTQEKPKCQRCANFGVVCDGYEYVDINGKLKFVVPQQKSLLLPKARATRLVKEPTEPLFSTEKDYRYFEIFCNKTAFQILPYYDAGIFRQMLLQACVTEPSLRHAVVALGALDMKEDSLLDFQSLSLEEKTKSPHVHHLNALQEYSVAISKMRAASLKAKSDIRVALLTSLMVVCFEAWVGNLGFAVRQIQTGLRFIREWHESSGRLLNQPTRPEPGLESEIVRIFSRLDCQIVSLSEKTTPEYHAMVIARGKQMMDQMPQVFTSLADASFYEDGIVNRTLAFFGQEIPLQKPPPGLTTFPMNGWSGCKNPKVLATVQGMHTDVTRWRAAFEPLWLRVKAANDLSDLFSAALLNIRVLGCILGSMCIIADEEEPDKYNDGFKSVTEMADIMLGILYSEKSKRTKFNFDAYTIVPLMLTGIKCRDMKIRRRAISNMLNYHRREGVFDSVCMGKMCEWAMIVEEEHLEDGRIPGWARIHGVTLRRDSEKEDWGILTCEQRVSATSDEVIIRSTSISWNFSSDATNARADY